MITGMMKLQPQQMEPYLRFTTPGTFPKTFRSDIMAAFGYKTWGGTLYAGGGKGGNGGSRAVSTYRPAGQSTGTYYSGGGGGGSGAKGGWHQFEGLIEDLDWDVGPVTVGGPGQASSFLGVTIPPGGNGGNGGNATATVGGAAGIPGAAAGENGVAGVVGQQGGSYNSAGAATGSNGQGAPQRTGSYDAFDGKNYGTGGAGGDGGRTNPTTGQAGVLGTGGKLELYFLTIQSYYDVF